MSGIKDITADIPIINIIDNDTEPTIYAEYKGIFCRVKKEQMRQIINLGGLAYIDGMLCAETGEEGDT